MWTPHAWFFFEKAMAQRRELGHSTQEEKLMDPWVLARRSKDPRPGREEPAGMCCRAREVLVQMRPGGGRAYRPPPRRCLVAAALRMPKVCTVLVLLCLHPHDLGCLSDWGLQMYRSGNW